MSPTPHERLRASDADREATVTRLRDAAQEGRLDADELDARIADAFRAATYGELNAVIDDLPVVIPAPPPAPVMRAGFGIRLGALFLDLLVLGLVLGVLTSVIGIHEWWISLVGTLGYFTVMEGSAKGATLGKRALGIKVVDARGGGPIGYPRAAARWAASWLSFTPMWLGYLWMLGDRDQQCWHDKLASDLVVFADGRPQINPPFEAYLGPHPSRLPSGDGDSAREG